MAGDSRDDPQSELFKMLDYLESLSKQDPEKLQGKLYSSASALCSLVLEAKRAKFNNGWATNVKDRHGRNIFNEEEANIVETISSKLVKPLFEVEQKGGAVPLVAPSSSQGMITKIQTPIGEIAADNISADKTFWKVMKFFETTNKQMRDLSREGPFKFFYESQVDLKVPIPIPVPPYSILVPVAPRLIPLAIGAFVESIRLMFTVGPLSNTLARKILSIVLSVIDLLQGDWKHAILSFGGYFGQYPLIVGIIGKLFLNAFNTFVAPDLQERIIYDMYKTSKSMIVGSIAWIITISPDFIRAIVRKQFDAIKAIADNTNNQIKKLEGAMQKSVQSSGLKVEFNKIPEGMVPSLDDINNLQSIARQPEIMCSKEFQESIQPLKNVPPAQLMLEMTGIPTDPDSLRMDCGATVGKPLEETMGDALTPSVTADPDSAIGKIIEAESKEPEAKEPEAKEPEAKTPEAKEPEAKTPETKEEVKDSSKVKTEVKKPGTLKKPLSGKKSAVGGALSKSGNNRLTRRKRQL